MVAQIFRDISVDAAKKQSKMVDALLEEAPVLSALPMEAASHGLYNVYEELIDVTGAGAVDLDEALPEVNAESKIKQIDLKVLGATMTVGEDKARQFGGATAYFAKSYGPVLKKTGADMERALLYNTFRSSAIANHTAGDKRLISSLAVGAVNYSIVAVHYAPGEVIGLYDAEGFGNGKVFDLKPISGGALYKDTNGRLVYGVRMKTYFGVQMANKRYASSIVNIDDTHKPTAAMMDALIEYCRGRPENTLVYMHPHVMSMLQDLKGGLMQVQSSETGINRTFISWNGVEIVTSYNFLNGTEPLVTVA